MANTGIVIAMGAIFACLVVLMVLIIVLMVMMITLLKRIIDALPLIFAAPARSDATAAAAAAERQDVAVWQAAAEASVPDAPYGDDDEGVLLAVLAAVIAEEEARVNPTVRNFAG
jgi:uncharacterized membrane protein YccC